MNSQGAAVQLGVLIVFAGFLLDWLCVLFGWKKLRPYAKVLALVMLILWTGLLFRFNPGRLGALLILALFFGLLGDFLLLFPDRCFKYGLSAFLLGHLVYLLLFAFLIRIGLASRLIAPITPWAWVGIGLIIVISLIIFNQVILRKMREPRPWWLFQVALYLYVVCLSGLMAVAWLTAVLFAAQSVWVWALALGGTLFFISDFALAYDRFAKPFKTAHIIIMVTYHLAQFCLALGFFILISVF